MVGGDVQPSIIVQTVLVVLEQNVDAQPLVEFVPVSVRELVGLLAEFLNGLCPGLSNKTVGCLGVVQQALCSLDRLDVRVFREQFPALLRVEFAEQERARRRFQHWVDSSLYGSESVDSHELRVEVVSGSVG